MIMQPNKGYRIATADNLAIGDIFNPGRFDKEVVTKEYDGDIVIIGTIPPFWSVDRPNQYYRIYKDQIVDIKEE